MRTARGAWTAAASVLLGLAVAGLSPLDPVEVRIETTSLVRVAIAESAGCQFSLELNTKWRSLHYRNACPQAVGVKAARLAELLAALTEEGGLPADVSSIFLGRLVAFPELVAEAALAANAASDWDGAKGRPRAGAAAINRYFADLLSDRDLLQPFVDALAPSGVVAGWATVEKVLVGTPRMTPVEDRLLAAGVAPDVRLPFDAMVWLRLKRAAGGAQ